ncbi:MAG: hypothetical protein Q4A16_10905 [Lautropia sp.]|nr:hypothetical protein [Lautropia sp.]
MAGYQPTMRHEVFASFRRYVDVLFAPSAKAHGRDAERGDGLL